MRHSATAVCISSSGPLRVASIRGWDVRFLRVPVRSRPHRRG